MTRTDIINKLISEHNFKSYLEIGVQNGNNFSKVVCDRKVGVDPDTNSRATIYETSDEFFKNNRQRFDIIFIDGLHHENQVYKDITNALCCLGEGGIIVCHDMNPTTELAQRVPRVQSHWNGDCWKAWVRLRKRIDLDMLVIDTDEGCGVIKKSENMHLPLRTKGLALEYSNLNKNRIEWLNLIPVSKWVGH